MHAADLGGCRAGQGDDPPVIGVPRAAVADPAQHRVLHADIVQRQGQDRLRGVDRDPVRAGEVDHLEGLPHGHAVQEDGLQGERGDDRLVAVAQFQGDARRGGELGGVLDDRRGHRQRTSSVGHVHLEHRQAVEGGLQQRLFVDAAQLGRGGQVRLLGPDQSLADRHRAEPSAELLGHPEVQALVVLDEIRVPVLVARAGDQRRPLSEEGLGPVGLQGHLGDVVFVDDVVACVAARPQDERVRHRGGRAGHFGGQHARLIVGAQGAVGRKVPGQKDQVVMFLAQERRS